MLRVPRSLHARDCLQRRQNRGDHRTSSASKKVLPENQPQNSSSPRIYKSSEEIRVYRKTLPREKKGGKIPGISRILTALTITWLEQGSEFEQQEWSKQKRKGNENEDKEEVKEGGGEDNLGIESVRSRLRWFGHVERMEETREAEMERRGRRGRPRRVWMDGITEDKEH
ncbi:hypothetical protein ILUMI_07284 [Ignelater luminosus]|uniref:Uncharacterized protein n=1 Tax=Ignelater luminosus TaxID=2038154 RepID=A0A8K0GH03_IGNLU|nr:hypothetical protein ILUMI_07284 [Ignelater luminosus]